MFTADNHTFVVCAYGDSPYLSDCMLSLLRQHIASRIVIATSTPSEYLTRVAERYECDLLVREGESDIAADWNFAIGCAQTPLVTVAHQDDVYMPNYVDNMLDKINRSNKPLVYFSNYGELRDGEYIQSSRMLAVKRKLLKPLTSSLSWNNKRLRRKCLSFGNPICCPSVTYVLDNLAQPIFVEGMRSNIDWDAWERLSHLDGAFVYDSDVLLYHRLHDASETSACIVDSTRTREDLMMLKKYWPSPLAYLINGVYSLSQRCN